ncbi:MAG TPA: hypothetical protein VHL78_03980 [Actinomycetota bacterium]|nr:hypothetical protein [Actinomycetota bacterium]
MGREAPAGGAGGAPTVRYADAEPNGLAAMLGGLIEANVAAHPERRALLRPATVHVVAPDADTSVSIRLRAGEVIVANGARGRPDVVVSADSETLIELSSVPLRLGFPDATTRAGRAIARKLLRRELRVKGLVTSPDVVARLNRLLSVR